LLKPSEYRHIGGGGWLNRHITFIVAKKAQFTVYFAVFTVYVGVRGWLKMSYVGEGWLKTSEYRHIGGEGSKIAQKIVI